MMRMSEQYVSRDSRGVVLRSPLTAAIAAIVLVVSAATACLTLFVFAFTFMNGTTAVADVPIGVNAIQQTAEDWLREGAEVSGTIIVPMTVRDAPANVVAGLIAARWVSSLTYLGIAAAGTTLSILALVGRLRVRWMSVVGLVAGAALFVGELVSQVLRADATTQLSAYVQRDLPTWWEPGFGVGFDPTWPLAGLVIVAVSIALLWSARVPRAATSN